ncbi:MAG TPA: hypothetical protein VKQ72_21690 [Aggregatilineales bacterium]|nr:hypothetical protein [Aggregatilineales bacterium]
MPPDTTNYMLLGYTVVTVILIALVVYLVLKRRNLEAEIHTLESIDEEDNKNALKGSDMAGKDSPATSPTPAVHPR